MARPPGGGGVFSPYVEAKFTPEERAAKQAEWNADRDAHWRVDAAKGELVSDGKGVHLATEKPYGDFEFRVDWMLTQPCGDSGRVPPRLSAGADLGSGLPPRAAQRRRQRAPAASGTTTPITPENFRSSKPTTRSASGTASPSKWSARVSG